MQLNVGTDVLPRLQDARAARQLLEHPRVARMMTKVGNYSYVDPVTHKKVPLRGLTGSLRTAFWPAYSPWRRSGNSSKRETRTSLPRDRPVTAHDLATGSIRGTRVHRHIHDLVHMDAGSFARRNPEGADPWAIRITREILRRGWLPLAPEYGVYAEALGVGTEVDMVCATPAGRLVFLEFKTGASHADFLRADVATADGGTEMAGALAPSRLANSPCMRAQVQLVAGATMASVGVGLKDVDFDAYVIFVNADVMHFVRVLPAFFAAHAARIWRGLLALATAAPAAAAADKRGKKRARSATVTTRAGKKTRRF